MADDVRIMVWGVQTTTVREMTATVNITDYLRWAKEEGRGEEMNDLSVDDFREYMERHGPAGKETSSRTSKPGVWVYVEEAR